MNSPLYSLNNNIIGYIDINDEVVVPFNKTIKCDPGMGMKIYLDSDEIHRKYDSTDCSYSILTVKVNKKDVIECACQDDVAYVREFVPLEYAFKMSDYEKTEN